MRYIPTSPTTLHALQMQAKALKRAGRGTHTEMLTLVAAAAGYDKWAHVTQCHSLWSTFVGPVQAHRQPLEFAPMAIGRYEDYSQSIAFPISDRPRQEAAAQAAGVDISKDGRYVLFEGFAPFDPGMLIADDYSVSDCNY